MALHHCNVMQWNLTFTKNGSVNLCECVCRVPEWRQNPSFQPHTELPSLWSEAQNRWEPCCFTNTHGAYVLVGILMWGWHGWRCTLEDGAHFGLSHYHHISVVRGWKCLNVKIPLPVASTCYPVKLIKPYNITVRLFINSYCCLTLLSWLQGLNCIWIGL